MFIEISRQIPPLSVPAGMFLVTHVHQLNMNGQSDDWMGMRSQVSSVQTVSSPNIHRFGINSATSIQYFEFHSLYVKWVRNQLEITRFDQRTSSICLNRHRIHFARNFGYKLCVTVTKPCFTTFQKYVVFCFLFLQSENIWLDWWVGDEEWRNLCELHQSDQLHRIRVHPALQRSNHSGDPTAAW